MEICLCFKEERHLGFASGLEKQLDFPQRCSVIDCNTEAILQPFKKYVLLPGHIRQELLNFTLRVKIITHNQPSEAG